MKSRKNKGKNKGKNKNTSRKNKENLPILEKIDNYNVLFIKNKSNAITVQSNIFHGFINEKKDTIGINHLLEHVLSNAYKHCKDYNCYDYLNRLGVNSNASTDNNIIKYYATGLNEDIDKIIDYIINITINPVFDEKLVTNEKQAVINELLISLDEPETKLYDKMAKMFYAIEGLQYMEDSKLMIHNLKHFNRNVLMKYYKKNYNNDNTLFIISGNYDKQTVTDLFRKKLPRFPITKHKGNYDKVNCYTHKSGIFHIKDKSLSSSKILMHFPTYFYSNSEKLICLKITSLILH